MRGLWRLVSGNRDFRLVLTAGLVSMTGDWILTVGLVYYVFALTGSTIASGSLLLAAVLPQVLLGSVAGVFVDRWDRRRTMVAANLLLMAGLLPLFVVDGASRLWIVYPVVVFETCVEQFFGPAEQALVPLLVTEEDLIAANAVNGQSSNLARLIGGAVGGVTAAAGGIGLVAAADAATFLVAAVLLALLHTRDTRARSSVDPSGPALWAELREGVAIARSNAVLRVLFVVVAVSQFGEGIFGTLFAPFVRAVLDGTSADYGAILSAQAIGGIVAGFAVAVVGHRFAARSLVGWGWTLFGAIDLMLFLYPLLATPLWPAFVFIIVVGLPGAVVTAGVTTLLQTNSGDAHRGRIFGAVGAIQGISMLLGVVVGGTLGDTLGIVPVLALQGLGGVASGVFILLRMPRTTSTMTPAVVDPPPADGADEGAAGYAHRHG